MTAKPARDPRKRPHVGDVFQIDDITVTVEKVGVKGKRWNPQTTAIHCRFQNPNVHSSNYCDYRNFFSPRRFEDLVRGAKIVKAWGIK